MRAVLLLLVLLPVILAQDKPEKKVEDKPQRYANMPAEAVPYRSFTKPYKEWYVSPDTLDYNGAARDKATQKYLQYDTVNLGFLGPVEANPEMPFGVAMLHGAEMAVEEANGMGGNFGPDGKRRPYKLMVHNDVAQWGASSSEIVKMDFDEHILAVLGSVDGTSTHIMLRECLKLEIPIMDAGTTDPTVTETRIPWLIHNFPDDRQQGYALADYVFKQQGLKRIGVLRTQSRYARVGVRKFFDEAQRMGHTPVLETKFERGDNDFSVQLRMLKNAKVQGVILWSEAGDAAAIVKQMRALGMTQPVFGPSRLAYPEFIEKAGAAAEGVVATVALDPTRSDFKWIAFAERYKAKYNSDADAYAAYGYDGMTMLIRAVAKAGLNRGAIMDAFREYAAHTYKGVAGESKFDYTLNNIAPVKLTHIEHGQFVYGAPYAQISRASVSYNGPGREADKDIAGERVTIGFIGAPQSDSLKAAEAAVLAENERGFPGNQTLWLAAEDESAQWGKVSGEIASLALDQKALALVTGSKRQTAHEAEQIGNKVGLPVLTLAEDPTLTEVNIPWIFRLPPQSDASQAIHLIASAMRATGPNCVRVRDWLASNELFDHAGNAAGY